MPNTGSEFSIIEWSDFDREVEAGTTGNYSVKINIGDKDVAPGDDLDVNVKTFLYVAGENEQSIVASKNVTTTENETIVVTLSHRFPTNSEKQNSVEGLGEIPDEILAPGDEIFGQYPRTDSPVWVKAELNYGSGGTVDESINTLEEGPSTDSTVPKITKPTPDDATTIPEGGTGGDLETNPTLNSSFDNQITFAIREIQWEEDARYDEETNIVLDEFPNPTVAIDGAGRFAKHEIIGGATVRQKIGEDPLNISINGVCEASTANKIDALRDARNGLMFSSRLPGSENNERDSGDSGGSLLVQFGSTSTEPMSDGGAADLKSGELLYRFSINAIEINR